MANPQKKEEEKKPYQKPRIASQEIYETMALQCNKCSVGGSDSTSTCHPGKSNFT